MTRRQWVGLSGVLFGGLMLAGVLISGTTPDTGGSGAIDRYTKHWSDEGNQDRAIAGSIMLTYAVVVLACFVAGLRRMLPRDGDSPLRTVVLTTGAASVALFGIGSALVNAPGIAAGEASGYKVEGNTAILLEAVGYYTLATAVMSAAAMAVAFGLANRTARVVPQWTLVLTGLLALAGLGSIFTAWLGFMLLPIWSLVIGLCLLLTRGAQDGAEQAPAREMATAS